MTIRIETNNGKTVTSVEFNSWEDLANSREEYLRLERVAVGRICKCGKCICCEELAKHKETK